MGILTSLFAGVSGINTSGQQISVIGDNIANTSTVGFKTARAEFTDVLGGSIGGSAGSSQIGAGSRLAAVNQAFTQGALEDTGVTTDLAIDGEGFFILQDTTGLFYTRAGMFRLNNQNLLVNGDGQSVLGFGITPSGLPNGALAPIDLSSVLSLPQLTGQVDVNVNLDPASTGFDDAVVGLFDHLDPVSTSNFQTGIRIFDSLGQPRNILVYLRKDDTGGANNQWNWYAGTNRAELDMATYGLAQGATQAADEQFITVQSGTLTFNNNGTLQTVTGNTAGGQLSIPVDADADGTIAGAETTPSATPFDWAFSNGAALQSPITFNFGTPTSIGGTGADFTTQFGGSAASGVNNFVRFMNQDGFSAGTLQNVSIDDDGFVTGVFSNGQTDRLAQIAVANVPNRNGLSRVGRNSWVETNASGTPIFGSPNQGGFGTVRSGFLEQSNTDLAEQFVKMIIAQRAFQANTRTVSTTNELLANLVALGQ